MKIIHSSELKFEPASHEDPANPGVLKKVLAVRDDLFVGRVQMINWALLPKGKAFRRHYHEDMEEIFVITKGRVAIEVNGIKASLQAGDTLIVAPNERHEMLNISDGEVEYLVVGIAGTKDGKTVVE